MSALQEIVSFFSGPVLVALVAFAGIYLSFKTRLVQLRRLPAAIGSFFSKKSRANEGISPFAAAATALSGTLGTGNIAGVGAAILIGGPGAIFWMWLSALLSMVIKYSEIALSVKYRREGEQNGPMQYIKKAFGKPMALLFCAATAASAFFIGNTVQSNTAACALKSIGFSDVAIFISMLLFTLLAGLILLGGMKRIAATAQILIPLLALFYIGACIFIIVSNASLFPKAVETILSSAFLPQSAAGGVLGFGILAAAKVGFSRGIFTNEAGLGSAPIAYAACESQSPAKAGLFGVFEVFLDTIIMCTLTGFVVIIYLLKGGAAAADGAQLTLFAFAASIGKPAAYILAFSTLLFAFAAILAWGGYGITALSYLSKSNAIRKAYQLLFLAAIFAGVYFPVSSVWAAADFLNVMMMAINISAVLFLSGEVSTITCSLYQKSKVRRYYKQTREKRRL